MSPSSLHEANNPAVFGFHATAFTSWSCARGILATWLNDGWWGSLAGSSLNIRIVSSPQAVAIRPINLHLEIINKVSLYLQFYKKKTELIIIIILSWILPACNNLHIHCCKLTKEAQQGTYVHFLKLYHPITVWKWDTIRNLIFTVFEWDLPILLHDNRAFLYLCQRCIMNHGSRKSVSASLNIRSWHIIILWICLFQ